MGSPPPLSQPGDKSASILLKTTVEEDKGSNVIRYLFKKTDGNLGLA
jgi:hypothetical protein